VEKPVKRKKPNNPSYIEYDKGYNHCHGEFETYNKWVLEPVVEVFEKYKTTEGLRYKPRIMMDIWKAIQETIQRSRA